MKKLIKNIFGDLSTSTSGAALGLPTIIEGIETLPADRATGILKITIGVGTLLLGLFSRVKADKNI
jgi:hypothetical protein